MAPRAYWKGFLRLSLVSCPYLSCFPPTSGAREDQLQPDQQARRATDPLPQGGRGHRRRGPYARTRSSRATKSTRTRSFEITDEELEAVALDTTRTIEIDKFVPRSGDRRFSYLIRPYYIAPDGKVGQDAFAVIRKVIEQIDKVASAAWC